MVDSLTHHIHERHNLLLPYLINKIKYGLPWKTLFVPLLYHLQIIISAGNNNHSCQYRNICEFYDKRNQYTSYDTIKMQHAKINTRCLIYVKTILLLKKNLLFEFSFIKITTFFISKKKTSFATSLFYFQKRTIIVTFFKHFYENPGLINVR